MGSPDPLQLSGKYAADPSTLFPRFEEHPPRSRANFQMDKSNRDKMGVSYPSRLIGVGYFEVSRLTVLGGFPSGSVLFEVGPWSTCLSGACGGIL